MSPRPRPRVRGAWQVVQFNWPKVLGGTLLALGGLAGWRRLGWPARTVVLGATVWTPLSVLASWWVYDLSPLRHWHFLTPLLDRPPRRVLLLVAGFDEVGGPLRRVWPDAAVEVVDVVVEPDASVRRARRHYPTAAVVRSPDRLAEPVLSGRAPGYDLVLFAQSAHELRDPRVRATALARAGAALREGGAVVVVEHLRDPANLAAFGPGALHFETRATWTSAFRTAGLTVRRHRTVTPLVHVWVLAGEGADAGDGTSGTGR